MMNGKIFPALVRKLDKKEPPPGELRMAAVAVVLRNREDPSVLLIKRADSSRDPWSGQVAFPGGKAQESDSTLKNTAIREAHEEVGLDLVGQAEFLGYFTPFRTHTGTMDVVPSAFLVEGEVEVRPNEEVASYRWVKVERFFAAESKSVYNLEFGGRKIEMPAFLIDGYVVWGLTHRIISTLFE